MSGWAIAKLSFVCECATAPTCRLPHAAMLALGQVLVHTSSTGCSPQWQVHWRRTCSSSPQMNSRQVGNGSGSPGCTVAGTLVVPLGSSASARRRRRRR